MMYGLLCRYKLFLWDEDEMSVFIPKSIHFSLQRSCQQSVFKIEPFFGGHRIYEELRLWYEWFSWKMCDKEHMMYLCDSYSKGLYSFLNIQFYSLDIVNYVLESMGI